jgi:NTE family protein
MKSKILIVFLFLTGIFLNAQETRGTHQPKVGLVLSGGGAKGFAHIGVLKVIDSLGIHIDYVAGTSMGAIIGSLYASGYSGKQLDSIFKITNFDALINDEFPRESKSLFERSNSERYAINLPFDKLKLTLPSGLSRGQNLYNRLYKLMIPVKNRTNFRDLPIPFLCVATNIETGKPVVFENGNLAQVVAASASFPSLFRPVRIGDSIYIDGGITNNYPVDELKARGMDFIIGADVQDNLKDRDFLKSAPDILLQISNYRAIENMKAKRKLTDIYIKPDISGFTVLSFDEGKTIIKNGEDAAKKEMQALVALKAKQGQVAKRPSTQTPDSLIIKEIILKGNERYTQAYILGKLKLKGKDKISYDAFNKGITNLVATNNFEAVRYQLRQTSEEGAYNLEADIKESEIETFLKLGFHYDELYNSAALINISKKGLLFKNDIAELDIMLGDNTRYEFDYFIDKGFFLSIGLKSRYNQFNNRVNANLVLQPGDPLLQNLNKVDIDLQDQTNQLYFQTLLAKDYALNFGLEHKRLKITSETLNTTNDGKDFTFENTDYYSLFGGLKIDTYDNRYFPNNGFYIKGDLNWYLGANGFNQNFENFSIIKGDFGYAFSLSEKLSFNLGASGGFQLGDRSTNFLNFALGGYGENFINNFDSFYGYDYLSLVGNSFLKAEFTLDYEIFKKQHILFSGNFANINNNIFDNGEWLSSPDYSGYALGYSLETFLGPIEAKYTWSPETGDGYWFLNVGYWF